MSKKATESTLSKVNRLLSIDDSYKAPDRIMQILMGDREQREKIFAKFLEEFDYDLSYEWFYNYFQDEHADRKNKKQDFTPACLSRLITQMFGNGPQIGIIEEPAAGTGSTIISHWHIETRKCRFPWAYRPDDYLYILTELSDKTVPFLLFNLMIRGMNAIVKHGNALTKETKNVYWIYNEPNHYMCYSEIYVAEHSERIERMFDIKFVDRIGKVQLSELCAGAGQKGETG